MHRVKSSHNYSIPQAGTADKGVHKMKPFSDLKFEDAAEAGALPPAEYCDETETQ